MIAIKAIHSSFCTTNSKYNNTNLTRLHNTKSSVFCLCKSNESDSQPGDPRRQELLAQIAMLQAQKVRLTEYLDERSAYLAQFGEEAKAEFDKIREEAIKELDEADARITANIDSQMLEFEESAELNRQEIRSRENKLEFEVEMEDERNEGLFFKSLRKKKALVDIEKAKEEAEKIKLVTREKAGSKTRRYVYIFFIGLLAIGVVDAVASASTEWRKVAVLGAILAALVSQFVYERNMSSEFGRIRETKNEDEK